MKDSNTSKKCPNCNSYVDKEDKFCKVCGHDFSTDEINQTGKKTFEDFLLEASIGSKRNFLNVEKELEKAEKIIDSDDTNLSEDYFANEKSIDEKIYGEADGFDLDKDEDRKLESSYSEGDTSYDDFIEDDTYDDFKSTSISDTDKLNLFGLGKERDDEVGFSYPKIDIYTRIRNSLDQNLLENDSRFFKVLISLIIVVLLSTAIVVAVNNQDSSSTSILKDSVLKDQDTSINSQIMDAINTESAKQLVSLLKSSNSSVAFNEDLATKFINRLNNNPNEKTELENWLKEDLEKLKEDEDYESDRPIKIRKEGNSLQAFIEPIKVSIENPDNGEIRLEAGKDYSFSGKEIGIVSSNDLEFRQEFDLSYFDASSHKISWEDVDLSKSLFDYEIKEGDKPYEIRKATERTVYVFVNDQNTGLTNDEFNEFGQVNIDYGDQVRIVAKSDSGLLKSSPIDVGSEYWVRLHIDESY